MNIPKIPVKTVLKFALLSLPLVVFMLLGFSLTRETPLIKTEAVSVPHQESLFLSGYDWKRVDSFNIPDAEKIRIKGEFFKLEVESAQMSAGTDMLTANGPAQSYLVYADKVYLDNQNLDIPLFFVFKMADMAMNGAPDTAIDNYKTVVLEKLRASKLLK